MTDLEISKALALAIGWTENRRDENGFLDPDIQTLWNVRMMTEPTMQVWFQGAWRDFDYRDPTVIWPIAEHYSAFPSDSYKNGTWWVASCERNGKIIKRGATTPQKAVALAVITEAK